MLMSRGDKMPSFGKQSLLNLDTCDDRLKRVAMEVIKYYDHSITCGHRGKADQDKAVAEGKSSTPWPTSKHNSQPSKAIDVAPYPIDWADNEAFTLLAGIYVGVGLMMGIKLRVGIDWDGDLGVKEHSFKDRPHIEVVD